MRFSYLIGEVGEGVQGGVWAHGIAGKGVRRQVLRVHAYGGCRVAPACCVGLEFGFGEWESRRFGLLVKHAACGFGIESSAFCADTCRPSYDAPAFLDKHARVQLAKAACQLFFGGITLGSAVTKDCRDVEDVDELL